MTFGVTPVFKMENHTMKLEDTLRGGWTEAAEIDDVTGHQELTPSFSEADINLLMTMSLVSKIVYPAIGILGSILNALVISTYAKFKILQTPTNTFLMSLTAADLALSLYLGVIRFIGLMSNDMAFKVVYCFLFGLHGVALSSSLTTTFVIAIHRGVAVIFPTKFKTIFSLKRCCYIVLMIWLTSILVIGTICVYYSSSLDAERLKMLLTTSDIYPKMIVLIFVQIYPFFCIITSCLIYAILFCTLAKRNSVNSHDSGSDGQNSGSGANNSIVNNKKTSVLTATILIVFLICWLPLALYTTIASDLYIKSPPGRLIYMIAFMMLHANSIINVYVFVYFSQAFRSKLLLMLRCGC